MALIAHWPLNGDLSDISGNEYILNNDSIGYTAGKIGQAANFVNDPSTKLYIEDFPKFDNNFTWSVWLNNLGANPSYNQFVISQGRDCCGVYGMNITVENTTGEIRVYIGIGTIIDTGIFARNIWRHVAVSVSSTRVKVFVDGVLTNDIIKPDFDYGLITALVVGKMSHGYTSDTQYFAFHGYINDLRIYDHALTDMEIQEIARAKILHYTFNDMQEPTTNIADISNTVNHGTPIGDDDLTIISDKEISFNSAF